MLAAVSVITFVLLANAGGDVFTTLRDNPQVSEETVNRLREVYGLDQPILKRYFNWLGSFATGDMGESFHFRVGVAELVFSRLTKTVVLGLTALFIAWSISLLLSFVSARFRKRWLERLIEFLILITASTPRIALALFVLALMVWTSGSTLAVRSDSPASFILSAVVLAVPLIAIFLAQTHNELQTAMSEDFVQLARAKGLGETKVIIKHAFRSALNPLLTLFGLSLGGVIGGSVIVETVLGWPGIGALMVTAVRVRDVPLVMGIVVAASVAVWLGNSLGEVLQFVNDKRLRDAEDVSL